MLDAVAGRWPIETRTMRWSEQTEDVDGLRKIARDWCIGVDEESRRLLAFSVATAMVEPDTSGNVRLKKRGSNNTSAGRRGRCVRARGRRGGAVEASQACTAVGVLIGWAGAARMQQPVDRTLATRTRRRAHTEADPTTAWESRVSAAKAGDKRWCVRLR